MYLNLTDEQMLEICRARERLSAYKNKIQPYPVLSEEETEQPQVIHTHVHIDKATMRLLPRLEALEIANQERRKRKGQY